MPKRAVFRVGFSVIITRANIIILSPPGKQKATLRREGTQSRPHEQIFKLFYAILSVK
jgi:hypothetical protein